MQPEIALVRAGSRRCGPDGRRGWNMIENWEDAAFETDGRVTTFRTEHLEVTFTGTGIEGGVTLAPSKVFFAAYTPPQKTDGIFFTQCAARTW